eukprot:Gb_18102 [translate_table: standard]
MLYKVIYKLHPVLEGHGKSPRSVLHMQPTSDGNKRKAQERKQQSFSQEKSELHSCTLHLACHVSAGHCMQVATRSTFSTIIPTLEVKMSKTMQEQNAICMCGFLMKQSACDIRCTQQGIKQNLRHFEGYEGGD